MKIFILHHHLNTGGVTQVIHSQVKSLQLLKDKVEIKLILGEKPEKIPTGLKKKDVYVHPSLAYWDSGMSFSQVQKEKREMGQYLRSLLSESSILHVHNLTLGKNPLLVVVVNELIREGYKVLSHCHDFAEDGRPTNYKNLKRVVEGCFGIPLAEALYPQMSNCFYGVLNSRDQSLLIQSRLERSQVNLLLNPVHSLAFEKEENEKTKASILFQLGLKEDKPYFLYPVRGIRRKNIGELVLLAALFKGEASWVQSQAPKNKLEQPNFKHWKLFSEKWKLPIAWGAGEKVEFKELVQNAFKIVSTSVVEGFGMTYLEPWINGKSLVGRNIAPITKDFKQLGVKLDLYPSLKIPLSWVKNKKGLVKEYLTYIQSAYSDFNLKVPSDLKELLNKDKFEEDSIDFAVLNKENQMQVIERVSQSERSRKALLQLNQTGLENVLSPPLQERISFNSKQIEKHFNLKAYGLGLIKIYKKLNLQKKQKTIKSESIRLQNPMASAFLHPQNFYLLRK